MQIVLDDKGVHIVAAVNLYEAIPEASLVRTVGGSMPEDCPIAFRSAGATKSRKETMDETGFPGNPK